MMKLILILFRLALFSQWRPHWNLTRPILMEKSPRHMVMTRLLQYWFTAERTFFIAIIRHPLAVLRRQWASSAWKNIRGMCDVWGIDGWIKANAVMIEDFKYVKHKAVVRYEHLMGGDTDGLL